MSDIDLSTLSFFAGFDQAALDKIAAMGEPVEAEKGAILMEQGEVGREAFLVVDGEVQIIVNGHVVGTAGRGSVLGEMALLDLRPRSATLKALTDVELVSYASKQFRQIVHDMPAEARAALEAQDERFRAENLEVATEDDRQSHGGR